MNLKVFFTAIDHGIPYHPSVCRSLWSSKVYLNSLFLFAEGWSFYFRGTIGRALMLRFPSVQTDPRFGGHTIQ